MTDKIDAARRSANMGRIRSKDTLPEIAVRKIAHSLGLRFRLHRRDLPGSPDLVFVRQKYALFVHGCFWHRHAGCRNCTTPGTRTAFWQAKFERNQERDIEAMRSLRALGWRVGVVWECEVTDTAKIVQKLRPLVGIGRKRAGGKDR